MKPLLCKAGRQLREQLDDAFPHRERKSDGWIGDAAHSNRKSDHNPDPSNGIVRAMDKRISYIIYAGKIASAKSLWRFRPYTGINRHDSHIHISFSKKGDSDSSFFQIPMLGAN